MREKTLGEIRWHPSFEVLFHREILQQVLLFWLFCLLRVEIFRYVKIGDVLITTPGFPQSFVPPLDSEIFCALLAQ